MRFILKAAFWLGLLAFLMPGTGHNGTASNLSLAGAFVGAQQAFADMTGFCDRAPQACDAGREFAVFAGERIGDGVAMAYSYIGPHMAPAESALAPATPPVIGAAQEADPIVTGAVEQRPPMPSAYRPPVRDVGASVTGPHQPARPAVPTPAPRA